MAERPSLLDRVQGLLARGVGLLPESAHQQLADWLKYPHHYPDLDPALRTLLAVRDWRGGKERMANPIEHRARLRREMQLINPRPTAVAQIENYQFQTANGLLSARLYRPIEPVLQSKDIPLLVFLHGGGFVVGDLDTHDEACRLLCRFGRFAVLSVAYRLAPEHPFPAAFDDAMAALHWAQQQAESWKIDRQKIAIGGDSAGGNLAATVSAALAGQPDAPAAQLLIYPGIELYMLTESKQLYTDGLFLSHEHVREAYLRYNPEERFPPNDPRLCPIYAETHANLAPALLVTAEHDVLRDEGEVYGRRLRQAGTLCMMRRVAGQAHGFINMTPINRRAYQATVQLAVDFKLLLDGEVF